MPSGIIQGAMCGGERDIELLAQRAEVVTACSRHQHGCEFVGIECLLVLKQARFAEEANIKFDVVPQDGSIANEGS